MALVDIRQRSGYLFLAVILGHVILISAQVNSRTGVPVLEQVTFGIFSEVQRGVSSTFGGVRSVWNNYVGLRHVKTENDNLKKQLADAQIALQSQRALADRARGLEKLLELRDRVTLQTTAAEIIGAGASLEFRTVTIDKGTRDGLRPDMPIIAPAGVVGRVVVPSARSAKVQLLVDRNAAAGAGEDRLRLENVSEAADIVAGDVVVTSGIEGIYPKGFVIGTIEAVEKTGPAYKRITVKPAVDFTSLEEVLVVITPTPAQDTGQGVSE